MKAICPICKNEFSARVCDVNRAKSKGYDVTCGIVCGGIRRRSNKTKEQKVAEKAEYDKEYRKREGWHEKHRASWKRNYDPVQAAEYRKSRMHKHVEYCRQPEYKEWKKQYDAMYRAKLNFGEYAEAFLILEELYKLIPNREVKLINGLTNKTQIRKRKWQTLMNNNRSLPPLP